MPPSKSGIADYSQTLIHRLSPLVDLEIFSNRQKLFDPAAFDLTLYHMGNNPYHDFIYDTARRYPGVVVMHESNLHHLLAAVTISRGDWETYLREAEYNGGAPALEHARRVRAGRAGPDYENLPMTRRLLDSAKGLIVHSQFMVEQMRAAGFRGPIARIPHGAWMPEINRLAYRSRLGVHETTPLIGIFGFLKPYKRITESLRAFRRLVRLEPQSKMILVGEPHPEFSIESLIRSLDLSAHVRLLGFTPIEDFEGYLGACDIILNLRFPTVGESSGTLLRALGLGRAVLVSDIGSFQELPDDICLKVPVDAAEEDLIFEYLNLLVSRPEVARELGARARAYVQSECNWDRGAERYASFLAAVTEGREWEEGLHEQPQPQPQSPSGLTSRQPEPLPHVPAWSCDPDARQYVEQHMTRLQRTLEITPPGGPDERILEMGAYLHITPALRSKLGYREVRGCYYGKSGLVDRKTVIAESGERFECEIDLFDAESDRFPYPCGHFATVLCCELIEHLARDPMHMMAEINRILKPEGHLVLTTPNIVALRALSAALLGQHPGFFQAYLRPSAGTETDARHNREYTPGEIHQLLDNAGFTVVLLETGDFRRELAVEYSWVHQLLDRFGLPTKLRGEDIFAVGRKIGPVRDRYPAWLYQ